VAQNITSKTANITDTIFDKKKVIILLQQSHHVSLSKMVSVIFNTDIMTLENNHSKP